MRYQSKVAIAAYTLMASTIGGGLGIDSAKAQCVQADIGVQYNISGSRTPARQRNDVKFEGSGRCVGNTSITTGVQGNVGGTAPVRQRRKVRHTFNGDRNFGRNRRFRRRGDKDDFIRIEVNPQIDIYNPADRYR